MITSYQLIAVVVRLFAVWLTLTAAQIGMLTFALRGGGQQGGAASFALAGVYLLLAFILWKFALGVARRLLPAQAQGMADGIDTTNGATVAFVAAGLAIIALKALTPVANYISLVTLLLTSGQALELRKPGLHVDGVGGFLMLFIGMALVVKARVLARRVA